MSSSAGAAWGAGAAGTARASVERRAPVGPRPGAVGGGGTDDAGCECEGPDAACAA
jgi:hypothetical protein